MCLKRYLLTSTWLLLASLTMGMGVGADPPPSLPHPHPSPPSGGPNARTPAGPPPRLTLAQAQQEALRLHPTLDEYRSRMQQARYKVDEAYAPGRPTAQLQAGYSYLTPTQNVPFSGQSLPISVTNNYNAGATLRWTLHSFGRLKWGTMAAELTEKTAQEEYRREQLRAWEEITLAYYDLGQQAEQLRAVQADLEVQRKALADAQVQEEAGMVAHFDVLRAQAALSQSQQNLLVAQNNRSVSRARLAGLLNQPTGSDFQIEEPAMPPKEELVLEPSLQFAFAHRPDMQAFEWSVRAAEAQIGVARSESAPTLALQSDYIDRNSTTFQLSQQWTTGLTFTIPLYDGGLSEARANQAREALRQLRDNRDLLRRQVALEVETLFCELQTRWQQIDVARVQLVQAQDAERVADLRYNNGLGTQLEWLDSQRQRISAEQGLIAARYQYLGSLAKWKRSLGQDAVGGR